MLLKSIDDPSIRDRLVNKSSKKKYTHNDFQNELLSIMSNQVLRMILKEIHRNGYYGITCDEYTDVSNKEQLSLLSRM